MHFAMFITVFALSLSTTLSAQQGAQQQPNTQQTQTAQKPAGDGKTITVVGCLQTGAQPNQFVLAATGDPLAKGVAVATSGVVPNVTYQLSGGQNLGAHVGHRVEITGTSSGKAQEATTSAQNVRETEVPNKPDPKVVVKEKAVIELRDLQVQSLKMVSTSCEAK